MKEYFFQVVHKLEGRQPQIDTEMSTAFPDIVIVLKLSYFDGIVVLNKLVNHRWWAALQELMNVCII